MDPFDYKVTDKSRYVSTGITPGDSKKPVAWGSGSSFNIPYSTTLEQGSIQFIVEPTQNSVGVAFFEWGGESLAIEYLQNGVYLLSYLEESTRVVTQTGPISIKITFMASETYASIHNATIRIPSVIPPRNISVDIAPLGGVLYDKILIDGLESVSSLVKKEPKVVVGERGRLTPIIRDKMYDPRTLVASDMDHVDGYNVFARGAAASNTAIAFLSNTDLIERSDDAETWVPVDTIEYQKMDMRIFRSKDNDFALTTYNTAMTDFIAMGMTTTTTGDVFKVGENVGSYFSHDGYVIRNGSITIEAEGMTSATILGYLPDEVVDLLNPVIDYDGSNLGKMHLYTIETEGPLVISSDEIVISGLGVNIEHTEVMDILVGKVEMSYADDLSDIELGTAVNSDEEYAILDLQWGL